MVNKKPKTVPFRRKREYVTNYKKRLKLLLSRKLRIVVRMTNSKIIAQLVNFSPAGDKVVLGIDSSALAKLGWNYSLKNTPAAYLTGLLLGKKALGQGHKEAILDTGSREPQKKGKIYAFLKGMLDSGLEVPSGEDIFPPEERITGEHIKGYAKKLKDNNQVYQERFARYLKNKAAPENMPEQFQQLKQKISSGKNNK
ncbi:MAG TPA: 50S ribosomal protein L18 [Candidatus Nanoarchaeia archaeon]|nr:50S ribosomal protein L18 [Candidatus Nanoarchaeia archaeon]